MASPVERIDTFTIASQADIETMLAVFEPHFEAIIQFVFFLDFFADLPYVCLLTPQTGFQFVL
jgi:hypothetical protein